MRHVSAFVLVVLGLLLIATAIPASASSPSPSAPANGGPRDVIALASGVASTGFAGSGLVRPPAFGDRAGGRADPPVPAPTPGTTPRLALPSPRQGTPLAR